MIWRMLWHALCYLVTGTFSEKNGIVSTIMRKTKVGSVSRLTVHDPLSRGHPGAYSGVVRSSMRHAWADEQKLATAGCRARR